MTYTDPFVPRPPQAPKPPLPTLLIVVMSVLPLVLGLPRSIDLPGALTDGGARVVLALLVTAVWVWLVGGRGREERPVTTLVLTGLLAGCYTFAIAVVAALSSAGAFGLIALPFILLAMLAVGGLWGLLAGSLAVGVQRMRGLRPDGVAGELRRR